MCVPPCGSTVAHVLAATSSVIGVVNSVIVAVIASLAGLELHLGGPVIFSLGVVGLVMAMVSLARYGANDFRRGQASLRPLFPGGPEGKG